MTVATEKVKQASERYTLVRLTPARFVSELLASAGSGVYTMTFTGVIAAVKRYSAQTNTTTTLTKVTSVANNNEWSHDETTGLLTLKQASAPDSSFNQVVVYYYLFYTSSHDRLAYETPTDSTTSLRTWNGRLARDIVVKQSYRDIVEGTFSISASSIDIVDTEKEFQNYLTSNDTFYQKDIDVWLVINGVIDKIYAGSMSQVSSQTTNVSVQIIDKLNGLNASAYMNDNADEVFVTLTSDLGSITGLAPGVSGKVLPYIFGRSAVAYGSFLSRGSSATAASQQIDYAKSHQAICLDYTERLTSGNRTWITCRTSSVGFKTTNFGTISSATLRATSTHSFSYNGATVAQLTINLSGHNLEVGDTFRWTHASVGGGAPQSALVVEAGTSSIHCAVFTQTSVGADVSVTSGSFQTNQGPAIAVYHAAESKIFFPICNLDYTVTTIATDYGNIALKITFVSDAEVDSGGSGAFSAWTGLYLNPSRDIVAFRATQVVTISDPASPDNHAKAIEAMLQAAGFTVDSSSVTTAGTDLLATASFSIPNIDESSYGTYLKYIQDSLQSVLGYLTTNSAGTIFLNLLTSPTTSSNTITDDLLIHKSLTHKIEYRDIYYYAKGFNPHFLDKTVDTASEASNPVAIGLHGVRKTKDFRHVLRSCSVVRFGDSNARNQEIVNLNSERRITYRFAVATEALDYDLGDDITLQSDLVADGSGSVELKIVALEKGPDKTIIEATDLLGLS